MVTARTNIRRLLWAACLAAAAGIAACAYFVIFLGPVEEPIDPPPPPAVHALAPNRAPLAPLAGYAVIWQKNFRPATPVAQAAAPTQAPPGAPAQGVMGITLVGTASDKTAPFGLFREAGGQVKCITVGQTIGGAEVVAISDGAATLKYGGQLIRLTVVKVRGQAMKSKPILIAIESDRYVVACPEGGGDAPVREVPRSGPDDAAASQALAQAVIELGGKACSVCLGLSGEMVLATTVSMDGLPRRRRRAAMLYRLEEHLPLDIEAVSAVFLPPGGGRSLALAVQTQRIRKIVSGLQAAGIRVDAICPTALVALQEARRKGLPPADHAIIPGPGGTDIFRLADGVPVAWYTAPRETADWLRCLEADLLEHPAATGQPPLLLGPMPEGAALPALTPVTDEPAIALAARGAAAILGGKMAPWADFRAGVLAGEGAWLGTSGLVKAAAALAALFLLTLAVTFYVEGVQYGRVAGGYESRQVAEFRRLLPTSPLPPSIPSRLRSEAARLASLSGASGEAPEQPNALETLRRVATGLPPGVRLKITHLQVRPNEISIEGEAPAHTDAEALAQGLGREGLVVDAPRTENRAAGGVGFTITCKRKNDTGGA